MKPYALLASASFVAAVFAAPSNQDQGHLQHSTKGKLVNFPTPETMTVQEAAEKCGEHAQLSCCNKVTYVGDTTTLGGGLSNLLGSGSGSNGADVATECSKINIPVIINIQDLLNKKCQQNVACCQKTSGPFCITLGSLL
ncbi:hypothetical protein BBP40_008220 [Aspergillus hancockii]|nr:hypothetical protein BBP40_008220 [Aspergillus hancockii]